jgi:hypothetical protein
MGCDIHLMVEKKIYDYEDKKKEKGVWVNADLWTVNPDFFFEEDVPRLEIKYKNRFYSGRNYNLFCALAGVREWHFAGEPPRVSEPKGLPEDVSDEVKAESERWGSDGHSHSYLTLKELKEFDWSAYGPTCDEFRNETMAKMEKLKFGDWNDETPERGDEDVRVVFWFDN